MICTNQEWIQAQAKLSKERLSSIPPSKVEAMSSFITRTSSASAGKALSNQPGNAPTPTTQNTKK